MINLLTDERKKSIAYAKRNNQLLKWLIILGVALGGMVIIFAGSLFYIKQDIKAHEVSIAKSQASLEAQDEKGTLERVTEISGRLSLVVDVLSREVVFSKLLPHVGSLMPEGTSLNGLTLSRDTQGGIDLSIGARDYYTASQVLTNLQASDNQLFANADANSVDCESSTNAFYPCEVTIRAVLVKENPFLLLNMEDKDE